jgi:O-antigen/teichoic acid export membrane protein
MGIVQRQVINNNLLALIGVAIGAFAQLYIYTLNLEIKGYADAILKWAQLLIPFFTLGTTSIMVRMLPYIPGPRQVGASRLFGRAVAVLLVTVSLTALVLLAGGSSYLEGLVARGVELGYLGSQPYLVLAFILVFGLIAILTTHLVNALSVAVPVIASSIIPKIGMIGLVLLTVYGSMQRPEFALGLIAVYVVGILFLIVYIYRKGAAAISLGPLGLDANGRRQLYALGGYSMLGSVGSVLATHIDTIFVNTYLGDVNTAVYSFAIFATTVIRLPATAVQSITRPIVAQEWKNGNMTSLGKLYRDSAAVLLASGCLIYVGALVCLPHIYGLAERTEDLSISYWVFVYLGLGTLFDLMTSINTNLIGNTDYFRWNVVFILILGVVNIIMNYLFLAVFDYGITGAAIATALSLFVYNVVKTVFIYSRMGIQPLSRSMVYTILFSAAVGLLVTILPTFGSPVLNILFRGSIVTVLFVAYFRFTSSVPILRDFMISWTLKFRQ